MKIRSITCFYHPGSPHAGQVLSRLTGLSKTARRRFVESGFEVQTTRLATVPFPLLLDEISEEKAAAMAVSLQNQAFAAGFTYLSLGPALPDVPGSYALIPAMLAATRNVFFSGKIATPEEGVILPAVQACGKVIAQVERIARTGTLPAQAVVIPGHLIDYLVVEPEQWQTAIHRYNPSFSGEMRVPLDDAEVLSLDERTVVGRRAFREIPPGGIVNLGVGMPDAVAVVANEEGALDDITLTTASAKTQGGADILLPRLPIQKIKETHFVDLSKLANRGLTDSLDNDGQGGWTDQGDVTYVLGVIVRHGANLPGVIRCWKNAPGRGPVAADAASIS